MRRVMLVDDEAHVLQALRRSLTREFRGGEETGIEVFEDPREALARAREVRFDLVISDYRMPAMDGVAFLKAFRAIQPDTVRLVLSAATDFDALMTAINEAEIYRYIMKPWDDDELVGIVKAGLVRYQQVQEDKRLAEEMRFQQGEVSLEDLELQRLEAEEPGITQVHWGSDGSVILDDD